ncbi:tetratricopeptide repeat protein [Actinosynnema mirum]|uniref:non-specific serine/threonine protein kinase n=1 Tax=Actinosynnema mirum (strain ATCC 29888 / DSM 43827 / JCM 3225 / NBRC 14064 / NCIMB 13271 / NRRL B-12336 / IMRU 3971 / 101) TaxID=446462 RepID=C6WAT4_ACTMD|nr:tetratricopeptide repeat protein [Actinosynnema mirum]ACU37403.1 serine/threonine protein kinase [Actinosynnema mirum DSM 43827]
MTGCASPGCTGELAAEDAFCPLCGQPAERAPVNAARRAARRRAQQGTAPQGTVQHGTAAYPAPSPEGAAPSEDTAPSEGTARQAPSWDRTAPGATRSSVPLDWTAQADGDGSGRSGGIPNARSGEDTRAQLFPATATSATAPPRRTSPPVERDGGQARRPTWDDDSGATGAWPADEAPDSAATGAWSSDSAATGAWSPDAGRDSAATGAWSPDAGPDSGATGAWSPDAGPDSGATGAWAPEADRDSGATRARPPRFDDDPDSADSGGTRAQAPTWDDDDDSGPATAEGTVPDTAGRPGGTAAWPATWGRSVRGSRDSKSRSGSRSRTGSAGSGSSSGRTRRGSTRSAAPRGRLGAGLVEVPPVPYRDPKQAVLVNPEVPEAKRFCSACGKEVGRTRSGRPGLVEGFCTHCGHGYSFAPKLARGELLHGQYEVLGCLAHGGLGWIYLAADTAVSNRWVVLKGLLDSGDADAKAAAVAERRFLAEVEHPTIVKIHNFVRHTDRRTGDPTDYIVMEYVGGTTVKDLINDRSGALPVERAIAYALEVLPALGYLHGVGLLYCDFKPDNVIQTEEQLKLIDLGAVRRADDRTSPIYGTVGYQAPEIGKRGPSVASDLYTVGRALALMCFRFDFRGKHLKSLPDSAEQPLLAEHDSLRRFLLRACDPDPDRRFASAGEMAEQLTGVLREVLAAQDGRQRPGLSRQFTPERRAFGCGGELDRGEAALGLAVPQVDLGDPAAGLLATTTGEPSEVVRILRRAPEVTLEVRLRVVRALLDSDLPAQALAELDALDRLADDDPAAPASDDWRPDWYRGLIALAGGRVAAARELFDGIGDVLPGEAAPKLAAAVCAEAAGEHRAAAELYRVVWRTDHAHTAAAFGLARALLACDDDRDGAVEVLHTVPDTSRHHVAARVSAVHVLAMGGIADVLRAGSLLEPLALDAGRRAELTAELLAAALAVPAEDRRVSARLLGCAVTDKGLRLGLERSYRLLARLADTPEERIALVDRANAVRPRTLV